MNNITSVFILFLGLFVFYILFNIFTESYNIEPGVITENWKFILIIFGFLFAVLIINTMMNISGITLEAFSMQFVAIVMLAALAVSCPDVLRKEDIQNLEYSKTKKETFEILKKKGYPDFFIKKKIIDIEEPYRRNKSKRDLDDYDKAISTSLNKYKIIVEKLKKLQKLPEFETFVKNKKYKEQLKLITEP